MLAFKQLKLEVEERDPIQVIGEVSPKEALVDWDVVDLGTASHRSPSCSNLLKKIT